jgi:glycosyltransferase involved in cell wall biosynthesis
LEAQVAALGLQNCVYFAGFVPDDELPLYYQAADLFVLPTRSLEGFGLITLEAFASELPVVGTPVGATPELLAQADPRLILSGSRPETIASGIVRYFRELQGTLAPESLSKLVSGKYTWATMVSRTELVYEQACSNVGHRAR